MGIWIRSQNKECLGYTNKIGYTDFASFQRKGHYIVDDDESNHAYLGEYPTKERALQVMDEIQGHIWESVRAVTFPNDGYVAPIFEMPAE